MVSEANESSPAAFARECQAFADQGVKAWTRSGPATAEIDQHGARGACKTAEREAARPGEARRMQKTRNQQDEAAHVDVPGGHANQGEASDAGHQDRHVLDSIELDARGAAEFRRGFAGGDFMKAAPIAHVHFETQHQQDEQADVERGRLRRRHPHEQIHAVLPCQGGLWTLGGDRESGELNDRSGEERHSSGTGRKGSRSFSTLTMSSPNMTRGLRADYIGRWLLPA